MNDMPGPNFGQDTESQGWFKRNSQKIVLSLIVILLAVGGYYFYKSYQQRQDLLRPALEGIQNSVSPSASPTNQTAQTSPAANSAQNQNVSSQKVAPAAPEVRKESSNFIARASKGNGATHLARQALAEYLKDKDGLKNQLKTEQKIYIEDYLQKKVSHPGRLKVGNEITFSDNLIKEATDKAQKLSDRQINNLSKYVPLVPSLQTT